MKEKKVDPIQEQLIQARQAQILEAALTVFAEKGFHKATIRDIARQAGIADGTVYIYFENKTALLMAILHRVNESEERELDMAQLADSDIETFLLDYLRKRLSVLTDDGMDVLRVLLPEMLTNLELREKYMEEVIMPTFALTEPYFRLMMEQGKMRPIENLSLHLRIQASMVLGLLLLRLLGDKTLESDWDKLPEHLLDFMLHGIMPTKD